MQVKTQVKADSLSMNHNETLVPVPIQAKEFKVKTRLRPPLRIEEIIRGLASIVPFHQRSLEREPFKKLLLVITMSLLIISLLDLPTHSLHAQLTRTNARAVPQWEYLGKVDTNGWAYAPAAVFRAQGRWVDVFAVSNTGRVFWRSKQESSNTWSAWTEVAGGAILNAAPSATTWDGATVDLCGRGLDNYLWCTRSSNGAFNGIWQRFSTGPVDSGPAAIRKGPNELHLFAVTFFWPTFWTINSRLTHFVTNGSAVTRTEHITRPNSVGLGNWSPAVCLQSSGNLEVFVRGTTGRTYWASWWDSWGTWSVWQDLGGQSSTSPAATCWGSEHMWIAMTGDDHRLWTSQHLSWVTWTPWAPEVTGGWFASAPALVSRGTNVVDAFMFGGDNAVLWRTLP